VDAVVFGVLTVVGGVVWLALATTLLASALALLTALIYLFVYTPMKSRTAGNTLVGAIPGALPPMIGWAAVTGDLAMGAWVLFAVLYFWQIPHFLAIAWLHRADYERAGLVMLPAADVDGRLTGRQAVIHGIYLLLASVFGFASEMAGVVYLAAALILGGLYLTAALLFHARRTDASARVLLRSSLAYLPLLFLFLIGDRRPPV
jgi:protoheme IX farnesyltransferase